MNKYKTFLCSVKRWAGYLLLFTGMLFAGGFFLLVGICIGVLSAVWSGIEGLWHRIKDRKTNRGRGRAKRRGIRRSTVGTVGKILVMAGVMGVVKVAEKLILLKNPL